MTSVVPILGTTLDTGKPAIVNYYNLTMGGTDIVDQLMSHKTVRWKSNRWTMSALAFILDTCAVNATTISGLQEGAAKPDTRAFRFQLVHDLVVPHVRRRMNMPGIQNRIKIKARDYLGKLNHFYPWKNAAFWVMIVIDSDHTSPHAINFLSCGKLRQLITYGTVWYRKLLQFLFLSCGSVH
jgi:hypothetical protein